MKKILYIAYTFPPMAYAGTFRTYRLCKYLPDLDIDITVITIKENAYAHNDYSLLTRIKNKIKIIRTPTIDPWLTYQRFKNEKCKSILSKILKLIMGRIALLFNKPDHMILWVPFNIYAGLRAIRKNNIEVIVTTSPPFSTILTGFILKKITGKHWIADMRDPIRDNVAVPYWDFATRMLNFLLENILAKNADKIITTTKYAAARLNERYRFKKAFPIYNSYDEEDFKGVNVRKNGLFRLTHIGTLYWFRKADALIEAIEMLKNDGIISSSNFRLEFVGMSDRNFVDQLSRSHVEDIVSILPMVSHKKALNYMMRADMLLLIKGIQQNSEAQIPSKLFEYIGAGNPILFLGPKRSEAADILRDTRRGYIVENDVKQIYEIIKNALEKKQKKWIMGEEIGQVRGPGANYNSTKMAKKFAELIKKNYW